MGVWRGNRHVQSFCKGETEWYISDAFCEGNGQGSRGTRSRSHCKSSNVNVRWEMDGMDSSWVSFIEFFN
jgi:hypothetical protein